jgi:4-amino-4-deoxy-L-arabinose transferase-like glycosyltransferase
MVLVAMLCILIRLLFFGFVGSWKPEIENEIILKKDALGYHTIAVNLLEHGVFSRTTLGQDAQATHIGQDAQATHIGEMPQAPTAYRTPGYPLVIYLFYLFFGIKPWLVILAQILLEAGTCMLMLITFRRLFGETAGYVAAILYATDPISILHSNRILTEALFTFLSALLLYFTARLHQSLPKGTAYVAIIGVITGYLILTRPVGLLLPPVLLFFLWLWLRPQHKIALKLGGVLVIVVMLVLTPWLIRNKVTFGTFSFTSFTGHQMLLWNVGFWRSGVEGKPFEELRAEYKETIDREMLKDGLDPEDEFKRSDYYSRMAFDIIKRDPAGYIKTFPKGLINVLSPAVPYNYRSFIDPQVDLTLREEMKRGERGWSDRLSNWVGGGGVWPLLGILFMTHLMISYGGALIALCTWRRHPNRTLLWFCLVMAAYYMLVPLPYGENRFRMPATVFYTALSGLGIATLLSRILGKMPKPPKPHWE